MQIYDTASDLQANTRREEIQHWIEDHIELREEGLEEQDHYLMEVNLEDLENLSGEERFYWLLQIHSTRHEKSMRESIRAGSSQNLCKRRWAYFC